MPDPSLLVRFLWPFLLGGLLEIGGGYAVWQWLREGRPAWYGLLGFVLLSAFGVVLAALPTHFGRAYAAYGGVFVVLSVLWGWGVDGRAPDRMDVLGAAVVLAGVVLMLAGPRG